MNVTKKQIAIGSTLFLALLTFPIEIFLIILIAYFLFLAYKNYEKVWKK
tara:strand:+ start:341 stop:487 length:147 start_codon:yes stop_codon:yes gene_type:complete